MNGIQILKQIRQNADDISHPKHGTLLSIDMDDHYTPKIDPVFIERYSNFLNLARDFYDVVHVWHNIGWKKKTRYGLSAGQTKLCPDEKEYTALFAKSLRPKKGESVLGKNAFSAFTGTDLEIKISKEKPVFIMGTLGQQICDPRRRWCIDETIREGLYLGFNVVAISDMINERYSRRHYKGFGQVPIIKSTSILKALNIQSASNDLGHRLTQNCP